jgi:magnesium chelatase family protein
MRMSSKHLREICVIGSVTENLLKKAMERLNLSARACDRILKVSRTIADLAAGEEIKPEHLAEAIITGVWIDRVGQDNVPVAVTHK